MTEQLTLQLTLQPTKQTAACQEEEQPAQQQQHRLEKLENSIMKRSSDSSGESPLGKTGSLGTEGASTGLGGLLLLLEQRELLVELIDGAAALRIAVPRDARPKKTLTNI